MLTLIATLIVWMIIQALFNKNPGPLFFAMILYAILSMIAELAH